MHHTTTDFSEGRLKRTSIPTDIAIQGEGFFTVRKDGEDFLTRAGNFRMNERGELTTAQGFSVLNDSGEPIVIERSNGPWEMTSTGAIRQPGLVQNLALVKPGSLGDLVKMGENLFDRWPKPRQSPPNGAAWLPDSSRCQPRTPRSKWST